MNVLFSGAFADGAGVTTHNLLAAPGATVGYFINTFNYASITMTAIAAGSIDVTYQLQTTAPVVVLWQTQLVFGVGGAGLFAIDVALAFDPEILVGRNLGIDWKLTAGANVSAHTSALNLYGYLGA